jgi:hypothetical protein
MKRRSFATISGSLLLGSVSTLNRSVLAVQIDSPTTIQTDLSKVETVLVGFENIRITPQNIDDTENITMRIGSTVAGEDIGTIEEQKLQFTDGETIEIEGLYVDILDNPNADTSLFEPTDSYTVSVDLRFTFEHPDITEKDKASFTISFTGGELKSANGFAVRESSSIQSIELESVQGSGGLEMAVWDNDRLQQNQAISATPSFNNFASGLKGRGIFDLEGRKFGTNMSDNTGESTLTKPSTEVTTGKGDA